MPIEYRHPHVQQDDPGLKQIGLRQKAGAVIPALHVVAEAGQQKMAGVGDGGVIVHQMN
jgi:hypothetical protein